MVWVAERDFLRPVKLFDQDKSNKLVRKHEGRERPYKISARGQCIVDSICAANDTYNVFTRRKYPLNLACKGRGVKQFSAFIKQDHEVTRTKPL